MGCSKFLSQVESWYVGFLTRNCLLEGVLSVGAWGREGESEGDWSWDAKRGW